MVKLQDMPPEMRAKIYKKLDIKSLLKFGESGTKFIPEILRAFPKKQAKEFWFEAAQQGRCNWLNIMIRLKFPINMKYDDTGPTALHYAARNEDCKCLKMLLDAGANVNTTTEDGSALHWAAFSGRIDCVKMLIEAGINLDTQDYIWGRTALHDTIPYIDCVKVLLINGANVNIKDEDGNTALHIAAREHFIDTVMALVNAGADVNIQNCNGFTALHLAASSPEITTALINNGAM
jgi:ankyrin repeat protein